MKTILNSGLSRGGDFVPTKSYDQVFQHFQYRDTSSNITRGLALNATDSFGNNLSHLFAMHDGATALSSLRAKDVPLNIPNLHGLTALHVAGLLGKTKALAVLVQASTEIDQEFVLPSIQDLGFLSKNLRTTLATRLTEVNKFFSAGSKLNLLQFCAVAKDADSTDILLAGGANRLCWIGEIPLVDQLALNSRRTTLVNYLKLLTPAEAKQVSAASTRIPAKCIKDQATETCLAVDLQKSSITPDSSTYVSVKENAWFISAVKYRGPAVVADFCKRHAISSDSFNPYLAKALSQAARLDTKQGDFVNYVNSCRALFNSLLVTITGPNADLVKVPETCANQNEADLTFKYISESALLTDFSKTQTVLLQLFPELADELKELVRDGKVINKSFGFVCAAIVRLMVQSLPVEASFDQETFCRVLHMSMQERKYIQQSWPQYVSQKVLSNRYTIDGFADVVNEFRNGVVFACLLNELLKKGVPLQDIAAKEPQLDAIVCRLAVKHIFCDKSLGSLFRFNSLWHREDMRLPEATCVDLYSRRWHGIFTERTISVLPNYKIVNLVTGKELEDEGKAMQHCVRSRTAECVKGTSHILSIRHQGQSIATIDVRLKDGSTGKKKLEIYEFKGFGNAEPSSEARAAWEALKKMIEKDQVTLQTKKAGQIKPLESVDEASEWFTTKSFVRPGTHPVKAIEHYAALSVVMNRSEERKWFLGAFRAAEFNAEQALAADIQAILPEALALFNQSSMPTLPLI